MSSIGSMSSMSSISSMGIRGSIALPMPAVLARIRFIGVVTQHRYVWQLCMYVYVVGVRAIALP